MDARRRAVRWAVEPSLEVCADQCGAQCCRAPGFAMLTTIEMRRLKQLDPRVKVLADRRGWWAMDFGRNGGSCVFLTDGNGCSIYGQRPDACRRFPTRPTPGCAVWPEVTG